MKRIENGALKAGVSLAVAALTWGVWNEILTTHAEALARGIRLPYSVMIYLTACAVMALFTLAAAWFPEKLVPLNRVRNRLGWVSGVFSIFPGLVIGWLFCYSGWSEALSTPFLRVAGFVTAALATAWLLSAGKPGVFCWQRTLAGFVLAGVLFTFSYQFRTVMDYPFSLTWSEGNRFWDYSVLFGRRLYDYPAGQPIYAYIDPGRQSLWGLVFLLPRVSIAGMRLWNAFLFTGPYILLGWFFLRVQRNHLVFLLFFGLWSLLFLNQGPIYTPLILAAILCASTRRLPLWLGIILTGMAGYYAISTRFTWLFAPAIWSGLIAFLETNPPGVKNIKQRWLRAILLGAGGLVGGYLIPEMVRRAQFAAAGISGSGLVSVESVGSMVGRQALLWDRLLPNPTYAPGILLGLLIAVGPVLAFIMYLIVSRRWNLDLWQMAALAGSLLAFLGVGLVASVKIGGGSNLHNLDMFFITLLFVCGLGIEALQKESPSQSSESFPAIHSLPLGWQIVLLSAVVIPCFQNFFDAVPIHLPSERMVQDALRDVRNEVEKAKTQGEILFIDQRQLLTFGYVSRIPLVAEYEKKHMMDMAMANDAAYFDGFYQDLAAHRFALIVTEPLNANVQDEEYSFGNENNAWVQWVSIPVLCYYEPAAEHQEVGVVMLIPKAEKESAYPGFSCPPY